MWHEEVHRLALLELWVSGRLRRRQAQGEAWDELARLPWTRRTTRRNELLLAQDQRPAVEALLDRCFPAWRTVLDEFRRQELVPDLHGWKQLQQQRRTAALPASLPERLNQRTATAALGRHSKVTLGQDLRDALGPVEVTRDGLIRLRPNDGLLVCCGQDSLCARRLAHCLGELALTERALRDGTTLGGALPHALLLVENVGFYIDVTVPEGWLVAHVPGWDTAATRMLLEVLATVPVVHCGDLDPNGVRIVAHLRELRPDLVWAVPDFWEEQVALRGQRRRWPPELELADVPPLVQRLAAAEIWLEQEPLALDPRFADYLAGLI
jgi:hypothetical protein